MKHLKQYEYWSTSNTGIFDIDYNNKKEKISEFVKNIELYIKDNIDNIFTINIDRFSLAFTHKDEEDVIHSITLNSEKYYNFIEITYYTEIGSNRQTSYIDITKYEYDYLCDIFIKTHDKHRKNNQQRYNKEVIDIIDPVKRVSKKYNL